MLKAQKVYWLAQFTGWGLLSTLILLSSISNEHIKVELNSDLIASIIVFFLAGILLSHGMRWVAIRTGWLNMKLGPLIPRVLLLSVVTAVFMSSVNYITSFIFDKNPEPVSTLDFLLNTFASSIFFLSWNGIYFAVHFFQKSRVQEVKNLQLSASQNEIELKNLRSQLNPHFLFNSLNSIRALIDLDPREAKENLTKLSNLLRKSLVLGKEQLVKLGDELDMVNDYLDLEKVRFEERLAIVIHHDKRLDHLPIPPFIVQTLVENAFKHGISQRIQGGSIILETGLEGENVRIEVINDGKLGGTIDTGIGLRNTLRRLELQYGNRSVFQLYESGGKVHARILLKEQKI